MKQNWKTVISIQRGGKCSNRKPFVGGVWIFSGTIHLKNDITSACIIHITYTSCKVKIGNVPNCNTITLFCLMHSQAEIY